MPVRAFLTMQPREISQKLRGTLQVQFDDGVVVPMGAKEINVSRYAWELWNLFPRAPLTSALRANNFLSHGRLSNDTHGGLLRSAYRTIVNEYIHIGDDYGEIMNTLWKRIMQLVNQYYNDKIVESEPYVQGYDILDMIEVARHPTVVNTIRTAPMTQDGIDQVYKAVKAVSFSDEMKHNPLAQAYVAGFVKRQQYDQVLGVRGFLTDVDSTIYPKPIMRGFLEGLTILADMMMESRSGAKALANSEAPLQRSEYFARRLHHVCSKVDKLHSGDCGSTRTFPWLVRDGYTKSTGEKVDSDLFGLAGKYYIDEDGKLQYVSETDKHLIGKTIQLRSPNYPGGCLIPATKDPNGICEVCFGRMAYSVPYDTNLGLYSASVTAEKEGQGILSTKHYDGTSVVEGIKLTGMPARLLWAEENGRDYYINHSVMKNAAEVYFTLSSSEIRGITDITNAPNVEMLDICRVSEFSGVVLHVVDEDGVDSFYELSLTLNSRQPSLSHAMLQHIREHGYTVNPNSGHFVFKLTGWDSNKPMFTLPLRHFNMSDHQQLLEASLTGERVGSAAGIDAREVDSGVPKRRNRRINKEDLPVEAQMVALFDLIFSKLKTRLSTVEVVYLSMVASEHEKKPYQLYSGNTLGEDSSAVKQTLREHYRASSAGVVMAFQEQESYLTNPGVYLDAFKGIYPADHALDWCLVPQEVYQSNKTA